MRQGKTLNWPVIYCVRINSRVAVLGSLSSYIKETFFVHRRLGFFKDFTGKTVVLLIDRDKSYQYFCKFV